MTDNTHDDIEAHEEQDKGEEAIAAPVADLVAAALEGNALAVQETFNMLVIDRIQTLIEERKPLIADQILCPDEVEEETEEDEDDTVEEETDEDDGDDADEADKKG